MGCVPRQRGTAQIRAFEAQVPQQLVVRDALIAQRAAGRFLEQQSSAVSARQAAVPPRDGRR